MPQLVVKKLPEKLMKSPHDRQENLRSHVALRNHDNNMISIKKSS